MRVRIVVSLLFVCVFAYGANALAQHQNPLVGAWERLSLKNAEGVDIQPPEPVAFVIFSADGYYSQTVIPTGRNKLKKPLEDMTKEELLNRFQLLFAWRGTYTVSGNTLTRRIISHSNPNVEGTELAQEFRIEGDLLILTVPGSKAEARFRRAQKG
jgi:Lipocalin-like domain